MKQVLSLLMAFVFLQVQARALSGGPDFGTDTSGAGIGTFAGVLLPDDNTDTSGRTTSTSNSLGVFAFTAPSTGLATGAFTYFDSGATYIGTIVGLIDPEDLRFRALVRGTYSFFQQFNFDDNNGDGTGDGSVIVFSGPSGFANGSLDAELKANDNNSFVQNSLAIRIEGDADLDVQSADATTGQPVGAVQSLRLRVDGFKQSTDATGLIDSSALSQTTSTSSSSSN